MPLNGNLREMSLANLIRVNCQEMRSAQLTLERADQVGEVYFSDGQIVHATLGEVRGEDAIYELLAWEEGTFTLDRDVPPPEKTIAKNWNSLLLEGMKRAAERPVALKEERAAKSDPLSQLRGIDGVTGVVIAASDGIVLGSDIPGSDGENEAAAAVFSGSAAEQLGQALQLGTFGHGVITLKTKRMLVMQQPDRYIGLILGENASPTIVASAANLILKNQAAGSR
jgi:predicted regulator of Ras-like GTPase activity (Roadblock/LC7/MglB family)